MAGELQGVENEDILPIHVLLCLNCSTVAGDLDWHDFLSLSFSHHDQILAKTETLEERTFNIHHDADKTNDDKEGWMDYIGLFEHRTTHRRVMMASLICILLCMFICFLT